jgi:hypothetical protein
MSVVRLAAEYPCRMGGPVLRAVDMRIFDLRYYSDCMDCGFCHDTCCRYGVDVDLENVRRLKAAPARFKALVGVPENEWFTPDVSLDAEFPSGRHVRTQVRDGACVFRNRSGRGCLIHGFCLSEGLDYHDLKPLVSVLFPLTFEQGVLVPSDEVQDGSLVCSGSGPSCYEGARQELVYYFGAGLAAELDVIASRASALTKVAR